MNDATFVAHVSRGKIALFTLLGLGMTALGGWLAFSPDYVRIDGLLVRVSTLGWVALVFFGLCTIVIFRQLFRTGAVMEIGPQGLLWRRWSDEMIPWEAFERAEAVSIQRQKMLSLWLIDPDAHRSTKLLGRLAGANKAMGFGDISLSAQGTDRRFEDMADAVVQHAPELFGR